MQSNQTAINYGLVGGLAAIAIALLIYLVSTKGYLMWSDWVGYAAITFTMVMACKAVRTDNEGILLFRDALRISFLVFVIASAVLLFFKFVLHNFVDTGLADVQMQIAVESIEKLGRFMGESAMDELLEELENPDNYQLTVGKTLLGYGFGLIFPGFIISLIVAAVLKRNPPPTYAEVVSEQ
jgi:hypothetical protein